MVFRGVGRQRLFLNDSDYERMLWRVAEAVELFGVRLYLYCLMGNHVHLLLETPRAIAGILGLKTGAAVSVQLRQLQVELRRRRVCSRALARIERQLAF